METKSHFLGHSFLCKTLQNGQRWFWWDMECSQVISVMSYTVCVRDWRLFLPLFFILAELEFVQIIIIIVVITVMVVVIICLLNHYKLSTRSFINRQSQSRRQEDTLQTVSTHCATKFLLMLCSSASEAAEKLWYTRLFKRALLSVLVFPAVSSVTDIAFVSGKNRT